jgi:hypothetical protein
MVGLYPLSNLTTPENYSMVSAFFSSQSVTVATTLPNYLLPAPSYTAPSYTFNTSVPWRTRRNCIFRARHQHLFTLASTRRLETLVLTTNSIGIFVPYDPDALSDSEWDSHHSNEHRR